jgi:hypothetical protein
MPIPIIDDILKGLPENSNLRARVTDLVSQIADRDQLNASLKDDLRQSNIKIATLQRENQQLTHVDEDPASTVLEIADYLRRIIPNFTDVLVRFDSVAKELSRTPVDIANNFPAAAEKANINIIDSTNTRANCRKRIVVFG